MPVSKYLLSYTVPLSVLLGIQLGGGWTFITALYVFICIPAIELLFGFDSSNLSADQEEQVKKSLSYSLLLWSYVPIQYLLTFFVLWQAWTGNLAGVEWAGAAVSLGISNGGIGITVAHELVHRSSVFEQWLGRLLLLTTLYMHFAIEHVYGHHKLVATPDDPATARKNEPFYLFWIKTVPSQFRSAWTIEQERLSKRKHQFWSVHNEMLLFIFLQLALVISLFLVSKIVGILFVSSAVVAFSLLEAVNYIEHYGLERNKKDEKRYEKVDHHHSWNSDHVISRMFLFELSRHSDHHAVASRKYQTLRSFSESPHLPTGYPGMIVLALIPPLWFKVMNPKVEQLQR
jgi:alkane 1-monooxygenase